MKTFVRSILKVILKLFAMILSPVLRLLTWAVRVAVFILSYGCIGLSLVCLIAAGAEFINIGITKEAFIYLALAGLSYFMRWVILHIVPLLLMLQEYVETLATAPIRDHHYDYFVDNQPYSYY